MNGLRGISGLSGCRGCGDVPPDEPDSILTLPTPPGSASEAMVADPFMSLRSSNAGAQAVGAMWLGLRGIAGYYAGRAIALRDERLLTGAVCGVLSMGGGFLPIAIWAWVNQGRDPRFR